MSNQNPCVGAGKVPTKSRIDKGECPECGRWYKLTGKGKVRQHPARIRPEQPANNGAPMAEPPPNGQERPKTNRTPDLSDEQYMEQLYLMAQAIGVMPGQRDGMPNVTTPPPIRPRWAAFLLSLGFRLHPELATHKLVNQGSPATGNWGPRERVQVSAQRGTMNRADLMEIWKRSNPDTYEAVKNGHLSREQLFQMIPADMQQAMALNEEMLRQEQAKRPPERFDDPT